MRIENTILFITRKAGNGIGGTISVFIRFAWIVSSRDGA